MYIYEFDKSLSKYNIYIYIYIYLNNQLITCEID